MDIVDIRFFLTCNLDVWNNTVCHQNFARTLAKHHASLSYFAFNNILAVKISPKRVTNSANILIAIRIIFKPWIGNRFWTNNGGTCFYKRFNLFSNFNRHAIRIW